MKTRKSALLYFWIFPGAIFSTVAMQACGKPLGLNQGEDSLFETSQTVDFDTVSRTVLQPKCMSCHSDGIASGGVNFSSYAATMATGSVVPGFPEQSSLFTTVSTGSMPKGGTKLSGLDMKTISIWISNGAPLATTKPPIPVPTPPTPTPTPPIPPPAITATFSSINSKIIQSRCISCHSGGGASAGVDLSSYARVIATSVSPGNPGSSRFYTSTSGGSMPPGGARLNPNELKAVSTWISAGALNN